MARAIFVALIALVVFFSPASAQGEIGEPPSIAQHHLYIPTVQIVPGYAGIINLECGFNQGAYAVWQTSGPGTMEALFVAVHINPAEEPVFILLSEVFSGATTVVFFTDGSTFYRPSKIAWISTVEATLQYYQCQPLMPLP